MARLLSLIAPTVAAAVSLAAQTTPSAPADSGLKPAAGAAAVVRKPSAAQPPTLTPTGDAALVTWTPLIDLPLVSGQSTPGLAGVFGGALDANHAAIAGGTFYGEKSPLEGGAKTFADAVLVLEKKPAPHAEIPAYQWIEQPTKLPHPMAHGVSVTIDDGVLCCGGTDGHACFTDVFLLRWNGETRSVERVDFPPLPKPLAFAGGARVGSWILIVGGTTSPAGSSGADLFGLDLSQRGNPSAFQWQTMPSMPRAVHLPICVGQNDGESDALFVLGGRHLGAGQETQPLDDGIKFSLTLRTWVTCGPIKPTTSPAPLALMGGTAVPFDPHRLLVLGGDDGEIARLLEANARRAGTSEEREAFKKFNELLLSAHPGYRREMLLCDAQNGTWRTAGFFPRATPAVTPAFLWDGAIVLAGGEPSPGQRSPVVWLGKFETP